MRRGKVTSKTPVHRETEENSTLEECASERLIDDKPRIQVQDRQRDYNSRLEFEIKEKESALAGLKAEIRSRQRLISQLSDKPGETEIQEKLKRLEDEIYVRDRQIEVLNDRVIVLDAKVKEFGSQTSSSQKDQLIEKLQDERKKLQIEIENAEEKIRIGENVLKDEQNKWYKEKEQLLLNNETLSESIEAGKTEILQKDSQLNDLKVDAKRLASIISEMSKLNTDLNEKLDILHTQLDASSKESFQARLKIQQMDELQGNLEELTAENSELKNRLKIVTKELEITQASKDKLEMLISDQGIKIEDIEERLRREIEKCLQLEHKLHTTEFSYQGELQSIQKALEMTLAELERVKKQLQAREIQEEQEKADRLREAQTSIRNLEEKLRDAEREHKFMKAQEGTLKSRIENLENDLESKKKSSALNENQLNSKIKELEDELKNSKQKQSELKKSLQSLELELSKSQAQSVSLSHRIDELKSMQEVYIQRNGQLEASAKAAKQKLASLEKEKSDWETSMLQKDEKLKEILFKMKAQEADIWNRDTELLRKEGEKMKMSQEIEELKKKLQELHAKIRSIVADELKAVNAQLEMKDNEIAILKDMVRSQQTQLKQKEGEVSRYRSQPKKTIIKNQDSETKNDV
ncbi:unnamed protein product [Blepharisma stoltei]|uniref:Uncharacterized protein n=1 Tax=Blepharisma stoltei TaxID=1481888 RepID=A0AAU9I4Q8_9CILI|nr:unnamed protein product [Blepharisma stoltei]